MRATIKEQYTEAAAVVATACFSSSCLWKVLVANYSGHLIATGLQGTKKSAYDMQSHLVQCAAA